MEEVVIRIARSIKKIIVGLFNVFTSLGKFVYFFVTGQWARAFKEMVNVVKGVVKILDGIFGNLVRSIITFGEQIFGEAVDIGANLIKGIVQGIMNTPDMIRNALENVLPTWAVDALMTAGSFAINPVGTAAGAMSNVMNVNDFVMTPNGDVLKTAPDDFIFGTKTPGALAGGGGGGNEVTINIDAEVSDEVDMRELARRVGDEIDRSTGGRSNIGRGGGI